MNYYPFHIGDFRSGTVNMSRMARWIYRDMLDVYYDKEQPLPLDLDLLCDLLGVEADEERRTVERVLRLKFVKGEDGYRNDICDRVIAEYRTKADQARANGAKGGRPRKANPNPEQPSGKEEKPSGFPSGSNQDAISKPVETGSQANQKPITTNQQPQVNPSSGQSPDGAQQGQKRAKKEGTQEDFTAARWMFDMVRKVNPTAKEPKFDSWANDVRLMRELDGRTHKEICELFQWAKKDSFWCANIQSPAKLREKWDTLTERRMSKGSGAVTVPQQSQQASLDAIRQANNEEAKRLLFGKPGDGEIIDA